MRHPEGHERAGGMSCVFYKIKCVLFFSSHITDVENFNLFKKDFLLIYSQIGHIMYIDSETDKGLLPAFAAVSAGYWTGRAICPVTRREERG